MYQVLIVEDEMLVRLGLKSTVNWGKFDMNVIADAQDGQVALGLYEKYKPDIIITDLKMPLMNGMELISKIRQKDKDIRIIILSCLEEFELVKKAMSLGVSDYILKLTMTEEDIDSVLQKVKNELDQINKMKINIAEGNNENDIDKDQFFRDFLFYALYTEKQLQDYIDKHDLRLKQKKLMVCIMEIDHFDYLKGKLKDDNGELAKVSIFNVLAELIQSSNIGEVFSDSDTRYILLFSFEDLIGEQDLKDRVYVVIDNIKNIINMYFGISITFGISSIQSGYNSIKKLYKEAIEAIHKKFIIGIGTSILYTTHFDVKQVISKMDELRYLPRLSTLLGERAYKEYNIKIDNIIDLIFKDKVYIQEAFYRTIQWIGFTLSSTANKDVTEALELDNNNIKKCETLDEIIEIFRIFIDRMTENFINNNSLTKEISEALQFIHDNYENVITLADVAHQVNFSPSYFSNIFKKETQVNFIEYLNEFRVEKAKKHLLSNQLKSYEIAEKVGFTETTYFSKVFKRLTGVSPNEYRKQWNSEWSEDIKDD